MFRATSEPIFRSTSNHLIPSRFYTKVLRVYPPKPSSDVAETLPSNQASSSTSPVQTPPVDATNDLEIHKIGGDLKIPAKDAQVKDDPLQYIYQVQILEEPHDKSHEKGKAAQKDREQWCGRLVDVRCNTMRHVDIVIFKECDLTISFLLVVTVWLSQSQFSGGSFEIVLTVMQQWLRLGP